ncbi:MAG: esterase family protein [Tannerellaceae bacterium]|nr:esterase family protein [Tannerellaceae bacterium]
MKKVCVLILFICCVWTARGAKVEDVKVYSASMKKEVDVVIITPEKEGMRYPVIYLLHGYGGNARTWLGIRGDLPQIADRYGLIFVCPDGKNSWYWDSPQDVSLRYETFISGELVGYVDGNYPTVADRSGRAVTGLSMGGHGALWNAWRHPEVFGAAGSTSGGVDIRPFPKNWDMSKQLGEQATHPQVWDAHTVINLVETLVNGRQALIVDCGYSDFFFEVNNALHAKLMEYKIDHDYLVRPGGHDSEYWRNSIGYQILFFYSYFNGK